MTLPASGPISLGDVNVELGLSATAQISMNDAAVRALFGVASGGIGMSSGRGKANQFAFTIASNQTNANLRTLAVNAGWNQTSKVVATINGGVTIYSTSTGTPAMTVNGSFPNGVELVNNGIVIGRGGNGGNGINGSAGTSGGGGGTALAVSVALSVRNNSALYGGGGGGGGGNGFVIDSGYGASYYRGSGGGGGIGGSSGGSGYSNGSGGTLTSAGSRGGSADGYLGGNGGSYGAAGESRANAASAGSGGSAVSGNGNITWLATGTRLGAIS